MQLIALRVYQYGIFHSLADLEKFAIALVTSWNIPYIRTMQLIALRVYLYGIFHSLSDLEKFALLSYQTDLQNWNIPT